MKSKTAPDRSNKRVVENLKIEARKNPVPGATNIPLLKLEGELSQLPRNKAFVTFCLRGGRAERAKNLRLTAEDTRAS